MYCIIRLLGICVLIALSGKKCVLDKAFGLNKQVSKDGVMVFLSCLWICVIMQACYAFSSQTTQHQTTLSRILTIITWRSWSVTLCCRVTYQVVMLSCKNCALLLWYFFSLDIAHVI